MRLSRYATTTAVARISKISLMATGYADHARGRLLGASCTSVANEALRGYISPVKEANGTSEESGSIRQKNGKRVRGIDMSYDCTLTTETDILSS